MLQVISVHRKESFEATAEIMDRLKKRVPIWKQEARELNPTHYTAN
jgi:molybdopterin synthase catalytic subunit